MKGFFEQLSRITQILLIAGIVLILYGHICRWAKIYFFWESSTVGWSFLLAGVIGMLLTRIKIRKAASKKIPP